MLAESPNWLEKYSIEALPESVRYRFSRLLKIAAVSQEGFQTLTDEQLTNPLFSTSDNLIKQFRHIVMHTAAFAKLIMLTTTNAPSRLSTWNYIEQFPELAEINAMGRDQLLAKFDEVIGDLYRGLQIPNVLNFKVQKPYGPAISVLECVGDISEHFYLHAQNMVDYYDKFSIPRSASMKTALG